MHLADYMISQALSKVLQFKSTEAPTPSQSLVCNQESAAGTKSQVKYVQACMDEKEKLPHCGALSSLV